MEKLAEAAIRITTKKGIGLTPICEEMESANGNASAAAALFVSSAVKDVYKRQE